MNAMILKHFYLGKYAAVLHPIEDTPYIILEDELFHQLRLARELASAELEWWHDVGQLDYKALFDERGQIVKCGTPRSPEIWSLFDDEVDTGRKFSILNGQGIPIGQKDTLAYFTKLLARVRKADCMFSSSLWHEILLHDILTDLR